MDRTAKIETPPLQREGKGFQRQTLPRIRPAVHDMIGRRLRLHYEELQQQPLPRRLVQLLKELEDLPDEAPARRQN